MDSAIVWSWLQEMMSQIQRLSGNRGNLEDLRENINDRRIVNQVARFSEPWKRRACGYCVDREASPCVEDKPRKKPVCSSLLREQQQPLINKVILCLSLLCSLRKRLTRPSNFTKMSFQVPNLEPKLPLMWEFDFFDQNQRE